MKNVFVHKIVYIIVGFIVHWTNNFFSAIINYLRLAQFKATQQRKCFLQTSKPSQQGI